MYDVVVIGGGPVGSRAASRLAAIGHKVAVVEKNTGIDEPVCCTGIISEECVSTLAVGEGVIVRRASGARIFSPSGKLLEVRRPEPQVSIVNRPALNLALAARAQADGAEYFLGSPVTDVRVEDEGVTIDCACAGDRIRSLRGRAVIVATGFGPKLAERLGLGEVGDFVMGAQAEVEASSLDEVEVYLGRDVAPGFFAWLVPLSSGKALAGLLSRQSPGVYLKKFLAFLSHTGKIVSADVGIGYRGVPLQPLVRTYGERLVVVGSAAGQIKPTTGGGIYYGVLGADIAAGVLHHALECDNLSARSLSRYQRDWQSKLGTEIRVGYWARKLFESLSDRQMDRVFDLIESTRIHEALRDDPALSFDWHSAVILRMVGHHMLSRVIKATRIPSFQRGIGGTRDD